MNLFLRIFEIKMDLHNQVMTNRETTCIYWPFFNSNYIRICCNLKMQKGRFYITANALKTKAKINLAVAYA